MPGVQSFSNCGARPLGGRDNSTISALNGPNGIALSDSNKTDLIAQSLESQFQLNNIQNPQKDQIISSIVDAYINDHTNTTDDIQPALPSEIINYIKKIKIKKSPGRDGITNKMIKNLPLITVFKITNIINNMFKLRSFPNAWKTAVIIPILKPGKNPKLAESYRPIFSPSDLKQAGGENYLYQIKCIPRERKHPCSGAARVPSSSLHLPSTTPRS
ncbi:RNA-directed DNA polymerase from mobile element jockey [Trichonephila clavipes]|nr:RNA-directed DNA polymerase from mobile element jockey [Trichonephila clavipes]